MATILFTWELGGGLGHLTRIEPLAAGLVSKGHRVVVAVRELARVETVFGQSGAMYLQAPFKQGRLADRFDPPSTYGHVLYNTSCGDLGEFRALTGAWQTIYDCVRPDLIVLDHSPTALIAARGYDVKRVLIGTGFCCPPDRYPLPDWRHGSRAIPRSYATTRIAR